MDEHGIIRVGGRLRMSGLSDECKHSTILPKKSKVTDLIVQWCHYNTAHSRRGITLNEIRCRGFWIICRSSVVKSVIFKACVCYFLWNYYFFIKWLPFKNYKTCFLFHLRRSFRSQDIQIFVIFSLPFQTFQIEKGKRKWNNLWCHELACINL